MALFVPYPGNKQKYLIGKKTEGDRILQGKEKLTGKEVLSYVKEMLMYRLEELEEINSADENQFAYGEKTAYVECFEWIESRSKEESEYGANFDIEKLYPL